MALVSATWLMLQCTVKAFVHGSCVVCGDEQEGGGEKGKGGWYSNLHYHDSISSSIQLSRLLWRLRARNIYRLIVFRHAMPGDLLFSLLCFSQVTEAPMQSD